MKYVRDGPNYYETTINMTTILLLICGPLYVVYVVIVVVRCDAPLLVVVGVDAPLLVIVVVVLLVYSNPLNILQ